MTTQTEALESAISAAVSPREKVDAINALAWELRDVDLMRNRELSAEAYRLAVAEEYPKGIAESLLNIADNNQSDWNQVRLYGQQALEIFEQIGDLRGQGRALLTLVWAYWNVDDFTSGVELGQRGRQLAHDIGDRDLEGELINNLGLCYKRSGNFELGIKLYEEALDIFKQQGNFYRTCIALTNLALANAEYGDYPTALGWAQDAERILNIHSNILGYLNLAFGKAYLGLKRHSEALERLHKAVEIGDQFEVSALTLAAYYTRGLVHIDLQEPEQAQSSLEQALSIAREINSHIMEAQCHETLSQLFEKLGDLAQALAHYKQFHISKEQVFDNKNASRLQFMKAAHEAELSRHETEIYKLKLGLLEQEISERDKREHQLQLQAATDELTGIPNRRNFLGLADYEMQQAIRYDNPLTLAVIDIDLFKRINDLYGHAAGDQTLIAFTQVVRQKIREIDLFARYGGDEFVLLFPGTNPERAQQIIQRIQQILSNQPISFGGSSIQITISVGVSSPNGGNDTLTAMVARADHALYLAKNAGRNRVHLA